VAAYNAEIRIGVTGQRDLEQLRSSITQVNTAVDSLNRTRLNAGGITQSLSNLQDQLARAARGLADVQLGSEGLTGALRNYVNALGAANTAQRDRNRLIDEEIRSRQGLQSLQDRELEYWRRRNAVQSGRFRQQQLEEETAATQRLAAELEDANRAWQMFEHLGKLQHTQELESAAGAFEKFKNETIAGNNALERRIQLSNQLGRIQQSVNATQERLSVDNSAAMMRQANMARMYREQNPVGNTPLLPYGDPTLAAIRGGARRVGSQREIAGGARTQDEAAATLRWAQATQQLIAPLNQVDAILRGIAQETARISSTPLLPSSEMLNAGGRRIQRLQPTLLGPGTAAGEASFRGAQRSQAEQTAAASARASRSESLALGVGFPLMFGAGPGMLAGSLAGSFIGSGFGGQILLGGLGQKLDELGQTAIATATAMLDPIAGFEKIKEAGLLASKSQEFYIQKLIEAGRTAEATAAIQNEIVKKVGVSGVNDLNKLAAASDKYNRTLAEASLQLQVALAGPLKGLLEWVTNITAQAGAGLNEMNRRNAIEQGLSPAARKELEQRKQKLTQTTSPLTLSQEFTQLYTEYQSRVKQQSIQGTALDPATRESQKKAAEQTADTIKDAYRTGFKLQQQAADLQRQGTDLQRRVAEDIYNKQQEILRLQVDNDRQRKQVAIEIVDLEYRRRISNEEGRVAAVLEAEAALMKTKAEGEATIESKRRLLELDIDKQKRETENYIFELGRTIDGIRRATLNYEMDVADYRLKIERQIGEQRRIEEAGQAVGAPTGGNKALTTGQTIDKSVLRDWLIKQGFGRTTGDFTNRGHATPNHMLNAMDMGILGGSDAEALRKTKAMEAKLAATGAFGSKLYGPTRDPYGHGAGKGGQNIHLHIPTPGGKVKVTPGLSKLMGAGGSMEAQLQNAVGQPVTRPSVGTPDLSGVEATRIKMGKQDAQIRREALSIEQQLQNLREQGALDRLAEVTRGSKDIQQREYALTYAKAELATVGATSQDRQELLAFEAQSAVKLKLKEEENLKISNQIKANDALTKEQKTYVLGKVQEALDITKQQIALDKEALVIAQQTRFEKEQAALQAQLGVTGTGLRAGFIGQAGQAFESEMLKSGDSAKAAMLAEQTQALELATTKARALESAYQAIGTAMATTLTEGVAGLVAGTTTAQQVFSDFLKGIGDALMKAAQQMIAQYLAIAAARALAGLFGGGSLGGGGAGGAADGSGFGATAFGGGGTFGSQGFQMPSILGRAVGGPVTGNTPYMVGERGPELFVPGSSGTIVPANTTASLRESMGAPSGNGSGSPVLNMTFETTKIAGTEYVSREQLEAAMLQTRRQASADGAKRGMSMTLDKLQQSPQTRSRVGIG